MPLAFFKDRFLPEEECHISVHDRSFRFGDGLFETLLVVNGRMYDFAAHATRLEQGLKALRIDLDLSTLEDRCCELIARNRLRQGYVRITLSRGDTMGVGYLPKNAQPWLLIQTVEKPYPAFREISLWLSSYSACALASAKTNNALLYTLALLEAEENHCDNALLVNGDGLTCETASGTIFWITGDTLYTPSLDLPQIAGTMRARALELLGGPVREGHFTLDDLRAADEIFMTNTGCILAAVTAIPPLGIERPVGPGTRRLRAALDKHIFTVCGAK